MQGPKLRAIVGLVAAVALSVLASCERSPVDATMQVDDERYVGPPEDRRLPFSARKLGACVDELRRQWGRPEMMALGGSVFNGVTSMQINWWLAENSPPSQAARVLYGDRYGSAWKVPVYPDHGADPYGRNVVKDQPTFRLGLDIETINLESIRSSIRRQGHVMSRFASYRSTDDSPGASPVNDNIAFAGAAIEDVLYGTPRDYRARLDAIRYVDRFANDKDRFWDDGPRPRTYRQIMEHAKEVNGMTDIAKTAGPLAKIFFALNSSFVLNPTNNPCLDNLTPLDQVLVRQPKRLLVGVGSNSGLFTFLYNGQPIDKQCADVSFSFGKSVQEQKRFVSIEQSSGHEFLRDMDHLLDKLATDGKDIDFIYVMGQLRPSMVANLKPGLETARPGPDGTYPPGQAKLGPDGYFDQYVLDFAPEGSHPIHGTEVKRADDLNRQVNQELQRRVEARNSAGTRTRFVFVSLDSIGRDYDFKHANRPRVIGEFEQPQPADMARDPKQIVIDRRHLPGLGDRTVRLDNRVLTFSQTQEWIDDGDRGSRTIGQRIRQGGLFSMDNLHPSVVGYALLAKQLLQAINQTERKGISQETLDTLPHRAYAELAAGNVLRRVDSRLSTRADWLQYMFDLGAGPGARRYPDCWRKPGDVW